MESTTSTFPANASLPSSALSLCSSAITLFVLPSVYSLLFLSSLPGNALSLWVFRRCISSVSPIHIYLSHLSVSNLLLSLTTPFLAAYFARGSTWTLSAAPCQLVLHGITPVLHINIYIGLMILTWVALSRFASLIQHTHASRPSSCTTLLPHGFFACLTKTSFASRVCFTMWAVAIGGVVPVTVYYSVEEAASDESEEVCYNPAVEIGGSMSAAFHAPVISLFFVFYLLVLLSYMTVLRHIRKSRRSANVNTSQSLLGRVFRNIVVIQVVISVCLLPYHIFKPIFIFLAHNQRPETFSPETNVSSHCHPFSKLVELKNCLLLLAALRGSTDPLMYFLLDKTFRRQILRLLRCDRGNHGGKQTFWSVTGSANQKAGEGNVATATVGSSHESVLNPTNLSCEKDI